MKLLFEEFFSKTNKLTKGKTSPPLAISVKIISISIFLGILIAVSYLIFMRNFFVLLFLLGLVILAESAHYIRKSREKAVLSNLKKKNVSEVLKPHPVKNKNILSSKPVKNKNLLNLDNVNNSVSVHNRIKSGRFNNPLRKSDKEKFPNTLLKSSKTKNDVLLKKRQLLE